MITIITGTPGCGKTEFAKKYAKLIGAKYLNLTEIVKENKLYEKYDKSAKCYDVDIKKQNKFLKKIIKETKESLIIDGHLSHYLESNLVDQCFVCKCDLKILKKRLEKRKYSEKKVRENLDSEIFDICLNEAIENNHKVMILDCSKKQIKEIIDWV